MKSKSLLLLSLVLAMLFQFAFAQEAPSARDEMIDAILEVAYEVYDGANGRPKRAQYASDIYICKNFTVHAFREVAEDFCMEEFPDTPLVIPNNLPRDECAPNRYGYAWEEISPEDGNPFYVAASFLYDKNLSKSENVALAREFLQQVQKGDYFQMAANYYYGVGAHSMIFIEDYLQSEDSVFWTDSNMKGKKINGERYAYVQYNAKKKIDWFVDAFCKKGYGATIYRLRDDISAKN